MARRHLRGLRVVVTGASGGIGEALAVELARRGARLIVTARREDKLIALVNRLRQQGGEAAAVVGDVTDDAHRRAILDAAQSHFGGLDVLVNNAGIGAFGRFDDADPARLRKLFEVDFFAAVELTRLALPLLRQGQTPAIVNVGSILGHRSIPFAAEYCAAKFAVRGFSESLRTELARDGIDVLLISPGTTDTGFFENVVEMKVRLPWRTNQSRQGATPESVARAAVAALESGRSEVVPGLGPKLLVVANRLFPKLVDRWMRRYV
jgi:short-subunit dehydrogenase